MLHYLLTDTRNWAACMEQRVLRAGETSFPYSPPRNCRSRKPLLWQWDLLASFSQPFLSPIAQKQVVQAVLLVRWRRRRQASSYRRSKEPVFLWLERSKGGRCARQGTQALQSLVHNTKSRSHSLPLQNPTPFSRPSHLLAPVPLSHSPGSPAMSWSSPWQLRHLQLVPVYVSLPIYIY